MIALELEVKLHTFVQIGISQQRELIDGVFSLQTKRFRDKSLEPVSKIGFHHFNVTHDMLVKFLHFVCGDPELLILRPADGVFFESSDVIVLYFELGHVPGKPCILGIPPGRGLAGIFQVEDRIKDRLLWQARGERLHPAIIDQRQFLQTNRTIKNHVVFEPVNDPNAYASNSCSRGHTLLIRVWLPITRRAWIKRSQAAHN